jgi:glycosyltransferase involved in cell wall biosynthesis
MAAKISIIIPCYNEGPLLTGCFDALLGQTADQSAFEVIMVDNNSEDNSWEIMQQYAVKYENFHAFSESNQGLSFSRNRGVSESSGEYLAFIDGDAKVDERWVEQALGIIEQHKPDIFGGPIYPFYITDKPDWFKDEYEIRIHTEKTGPLPKGKFLSGSNIVFERSLLVDLGGFNNDLGMKGGNLAYGEEIALIKHAHELDKNLYYDLDLKVEHLVPEFKMNLLFMMSTRIERGTSVFATQVAAGQEFNPFGSEIERQNLINTIDQTIGEFPKQLAKFRKGETDSTPEEIIIEQLGPLLYKLGFETARQKHITRQSGVFNKIKNMLRK